MRHAERVLGADTWTAIGQATFGFLAACLVLLVAVGLPVAIARDMRSRGRTGWAYGVLTLVAMPVGVAAWLIDRRRFRV
jgi:hypothetical protein